jgi:hypothetical protein
MRDEPILPPVPTARLRAEVEALPPDAHLCTQGAFAVYAASAHAAPSLLTEIGRLRELSARAAGEGTGHPLDLDAWDGWYDHLFCWHHATASVTGAWRIGRLDTILPAHGTEGLATAATFAWDTAPSADTIEVGRLCERSEASPFAARLLWRGLGRWIARRPSVRRILGHVRIDARYSPESVTRMVGFATALAPARPLALRARRPWRLPAPELAPLVSAHSSDVVSLARSVEARDERSLPFALRKLLKLDARAVAVAAGPRDAGAEVLLLADLDALDVRRLDKLLGPDGASTFRAGRRPTLRVVA